MISLTTALEDAKRVVHQLLFEGPGTPVFISVGRGRLYVGHGPAERFADAPGTPTNWSVSSIEELDRVFCDPEFVKAFGEGVNV